MSREKPRDGVGDGPGGPQPHKRNDSGPPAWLLFGVLFAAIVALMASLACEGTGPTMPGAATPNIPNPGDPITAPPVAGNPNPGTPTAPSGDKVLDLGEGEGSFSAPRLVSIEPGAKQFVFFDVEADGPGAFEARLAVRDGSCETVEVVPNWIRQDEDEADIDARETAPGGPYCSVAVYEIAFGAAGSDSFAVPFEAGEKGAALVTVLFQNEDGSERAEDVIDVRVGQ